MIKIPLPENFEKRKVIDNIYTGIADKIYQEFKAANLSFEYNGKVRNFTSVSEVKNFLLAKNFYDYKFQYCSNFMRDLINLPSNMKIKTILNGKSTSSNLSAFSFKYNRSEYQRDYNRLSLYDTLTINMFKTKSTDSDVEQYKQVCKIFDYHKLKNRDRHAILNEMNIRVCPYCNMNYTISFTDEGVEKNTADIDHFYIQSKYPEYSLCLYNFVPACPVCNQKIKGMHRMTKETHIYPYSEEFGDQCYFRIKNLLEYLIQDKNQDIQATVILSNPTRNYRMKHSIDDFKLNERYERFSSFAEELIRKVQIYNEIYATSLQETFKGLFDSENIKNLIFGRRLSSEEYGKISLGKFTHDILEQLGIF